MGLSVAGGVAAGTFLGTSLAGYAALEGLNDDYVIFAAIFAGGAGEGGARLQHHHSQHHPGQPDHQTDCQSHGP